jgi:hypothetical protein
MPKWEEKAVEPVVEAVVEAAPVAEPVAEPVVEPVVEAAPAVEPEVAAEVEKVVIGKAIKSAKDELKGEERVRVRFAGASAIGVSDGTFIRFVDGVANVAAKHLDELKKYGVEKF